MLGIINSCCCLGMETHLVRVEVDVSPGLPSFTIVGLPDAAVRESTERVRGAIRNAGYEFPLKRITVNLAPADLRKEGSLFDLPIAVGILTATGQVPQEQAGRYLLVGELSLDGQVRPVPGILLMAGNLLQEGSDLTLIVPLSNLAEASLLRPEGVLGGSNLGEIIGFLRQEGHLQEGIPQLAGEQRQALEGAAGDGQPDFSDVKGQERVKRALEIAAAGGHNVLIL